MKLPFETWATRDKFTYFFCGGALLMIAIVLMSLHLSDPKITSKQDLEFFNGKLVEHHYYHSPRSDRECWFQIKDCSNSFDINGNNLKALDISGFENLMDGDSVTIGVSKRDFSRVNSGIGGIFIYSLSTTNHTLLDCIRSKIITTIISIIFVLLF